MLSRCPCTNDGQGLSTKGMSSTHFLHLKKCIIHDIVKMLFDNLEHNSISQDFFFGIPSIKILSKEYSYKVIIITICSNIMKSSIVRYWKFVILFLKNRNVSAIFLLPSLLKYAVEPSELGTTVRRHGGTLFLSS